jgi:hypothetical protein
MGEGMAAPLPRWILGVTTTALLALAAAPAAAEGGRRSFTVSATVVRAAAIRVAARPEAGGVRIDARVDGRGAAGVAVAGAGDTRATRAAAAPLSSRRRSACASRAFRAAGNRG